MPSRIPEVLAIIGEAVPDFLWMSTASGAPVYQNRAWREYTGMDGGDLATPIWEALTHPDDLESFRQMWAQATREAKPFEIEHRCRRHDGAYRWFLCRAAPIRDATGETTHWVGTVTDIHAQKIVEAELARSIRRRDEFLATMAHEVRNPLQAMRQALDVVRIPTAPAEVRTRMLSVLHNQLQQLTRLTNDMVDGNRVRWNAMSLVPAETTLRVLVTDAVSSAKAVMEAHDHRLDVDVTDPDCLMTVDAMRVIQALVNLLTNAAKFSEAGLPVHLSASCDSGEAVFVVRDWGRGIDADTLPRIFELFERGECEQRSEGFGIGLALVRHVAELHGGRVEAQSAGLGQGSEFTLRIPLVAAPRT
ncbi:MAG: PAS domain-containing sensor histidine kinase [Gemmatimonadaceae bacterium]